MPPPAEAEKLIDTRIALQVERIQAANALGKSEPLHRLLIYLASRAGRSETPKEFEIAHEVFGKDGSFDVGQDATTRVYVHRLRKKLDEFYAGASPETDRLRIPRGVYRIVLNSEDCPAEHDHDDHARSLRSYLPDRRILAAIALTIVAGAIAIAVAIYSRDRQAKPVVVSPPLASSAVWRPLANSSLRTFFVVGDRTISHEDGSVVSAGSLKAVLRLAPVAAAIAPPSVGAPPVTTVSRMSPYMVKESNIVYVGPLSHLGLLESVVFANSKFAHDHDSDTLIDRASGQHFTTQAAPSANGEFTSYGYLASLSGPSGNRILIVSGSGDAPLLQMAEIAADQRQIDALSARGGAAFEALYSVTMLREVNIAHRLLLVHSLSASRR